jgi:hypothetical protein
MTTQNDTGFKSFTATAVAIEANVRVAQDSSGTIAKASATDLGIGWTQAYIAASGTGTIKLIGAPGTQLAQAAGPITRGAQLYAAADGEVDDTGTYKIPFIAGEAATAQGDVIEIVPVTDSYASTLVFQASDVGTLAATGNSQGTGAAITKAITYVTAADDTTGVVLPSCAAGLVYVVHNTVANKHLHIFPASGDNIIPIGADTAMQLAASSTAIFWGLGTTNWAAIQGTAPSAS